MRSSASALAAAVTLALAGAGCSSEPATEETEEGALSLPAELQGDRFQFRVNSPEEQQGVDARNAYGAAVLAKAVYLEKSPAEMAAVLKGSSASATSARRTSSSSRPRRAASIRERIPSSTAPTACT